MVPPDSGFVKLNFDGCLINQGLIIRNENGKPILAGARRIGHNTKSVAGCLALHDGLWMAKIRNFKRINVQGVSKLVIDSI